MQWQANGILRVLDACCDHFTFPMLDNGYVYLAATRMSLYRSDEDWALVIEVFGFSPREGIPSTAVYTFASTLAGRKPIDLWANRSAYERHEAANPHNESKYLCPVESGSWQNAEFGELLASGNHPVMVNGKTMQIPPLSKYEKQGIILEGTSQVYTFEFCRWLAAVARDEVLSSAEERRGCVPPMLVQIMQLEEWNHPDVVDEKCRPSNNETFRQLAEVLVTGDVSLYQPTLSPSTHWSNWPDGGTL